MDSLHFTQLCFLLLTTAAPRPSIALSSDGPAETSQDSFSKTDVTVYHCKGCNSSACKPSNYEDFVKIAETQDQIFSNEVIESVTSETNITMCFHQENTFPKGIYAIVWQKALGAGDSCGMLNLGASSENVRGNNKICCVAKTDLSLPSIPLNCYTELVDEKNTKSTLSVTNEGNPQFSVATKINVPVLILGVFGVALTICCV